MTTRLTITEALAEIAMLNKRIETHFAFVSARIARPAMMMDPLAGEGGTGEVLRRHRQAAKDLRERWVKLRSAVAKVNQGAELTIEGVTRSIADWIVWRREVMPGTKRELDQLAASVDNLRKQALQRGGAVKQESSDNQADIVLHISETELLAERDRLDKILGTLDGQLSLKNATTFVEVED